MTDNQKATLSAAVVAVAKCDARIDHLDWWILHAPSGVCRQWALTERAELVHQTHGNLLVDLRAAMAVFA